MEKSIKYRGNYFDYPKKIKILLFIYITGFAIGTTTHTIELIKGGFLPYTNVPLWKNIYWTLLTLLDFTAIILVLKKIIPALVLSSLIIVSDVIINTIGVQIDQLHNFSYSYRLIMQIMFCIYILITTPIIIKQLKKCMCVPKKNLSKKKHNSHFCC